MTSGPPGLVVAEGQNGSMRYLGRDRTWIPIACAGVWEVNESAFPSWEHLMSPRGKRLMELKIVSSKDVKGRERPFNTPQKKPMRTWRTGTHLTSPPRANAGD